MLSDMVRVESRAELVWSGPGSHRCFFILAGPGPDDPTLPSVGAIIDRPWILPMQNPSPQGETRLFTFQESEKLRFSAGDS